MTSRIACLCLVLTAGCGAAPAPASVDELDEALTATCPGKDVVEGIDVSGYQPNTDWPSVKKAGRQFAIIKATEGTGYTNPYFARDWSQSKSAGLLRGAYHFFHANIDPVAQADYFVKVMGTLAPGDLPPMLDLEVTDSESAATVLSNAKKFLTEVQKKTGRAPILYTYPDFWDNQMGNPSGYGAYPLNMASYGACPPLPSSWSAITFWQYSSTGSVAGVGGDVDEDRFYGTLDELKLLASGFIVKGAIRAEYDGLGGPSSFLGLPTTDETATPDGVGRFNHFEHGSIYWTPSTGAHEVHGAIGKKWAALGWEQSMLGYPTTDETAAPDGAGRFNHFEHGAIYWTAALGAHEVDGPIYDEWAKRGWEKSALGYPISDVYPVAGGEACDFEHGSLFHDTQTGTVSDGTGAPVGGDGASGGDAGDGTSGDVTPGAGAAMGPHGGCAVGGGGNGSDAALLLVLCALAAAAIRRRA